MTRQEWRIHQGRPFEEYISDLSPKTLLNYEVLRETTIDAVAALLEIDTPTVIEHLQRAEGNLLDRHLSL